MDKKLEKLTGAVSVDGDVTPTLREPIKSVTPGDWTEMSTTQLWEQRSILQTRIHYASSTGHPALIAQIQRGVATIDAILDDRSTKTENLLF